MNKKISLKTGTMNILNGISMLFMKLLTNKAQIFADVRTYWSGEAVKRVTGYELEGKAKEADGFIHLINSGAACLDASGKSTDENGLGTIKPWYDVTEQDQNAMLDATTWNAADNGYFRGGGFSSRFLTQAEMPCTMIRLNLIKGLGPVLQIAEGWTINLPDEISDKLWKRTDYTWPCTWFAPICNGENGMFKTATFYVQQKELDYAMAPLAIQKNAYNQELISQTKYITLNGASEITEGISVITTPGHSPGSQSVIVNTEKGNFIIVGDLICLYACMERNPMIINGLHTNLFEYYESMDKVAETGFHVLPGHEPKILEHSVFPDNK